MKYIGKLPMQELPLHHDHSMINPQPALQVNKNEEGNSFFLIFIYLQKHRRWHGHRNTR